MRIFTAIPLPEGVKDKVAEITRGRLPIPYVNTTHLHVTLNFFGELDTDQVAKAKKAFMEVCPGHEPFTVEFEKIMAHHNRQLHMTVKRSRELLDLQLALEDAFSKQGFRFQHRDYYAHVKLANMHMDNVMNRERKIEDFPHGELAQLNFKAERIVLYESKLLLHHAKHEELLECKLTE
jgi:RNA 2',3'-cyclic 3'-phosphodiesterase